MHSPPHRARDDNETRLSTARKLPRGLG